jgi:UDP-MurNAc hydroxylase
MKVTFLGHAGLFVETDHGSILCDPWFNPAFFASWFPFPDNQDVDLDAISDPDFLYVSHLHHDHFDPRFLRDHVDKQATVLLPQYPMPHLQDALAALGFTRFVQTTNGQPLSLDGLRVMIVALVAPTDGPIGDSGLAVDDGRVSIFNQNDSRPLDLEPLTDFGAFDGHFLQYSGAIWYPMVYDFPPRMKQTLGRKKRQNEMARAKRYAEELGASYVFPCAGPPCFLDPELFDLNDFDRDPANTFPDQSVFLELLREHGLTGGRLLVPGSVATLAPGSCQVDHPVPDDEVAAIFADKRAYLEAYQARRLPQLQAAKAAWPRGQVEDLVGAHQALSAPTTPARASTAGSCWRPAATRWWSTSSTAASMPGTASRAATASASTGPWSRPASSATRRTGSTSCSCPAASRRIGMGPTTSSSTTSSRPSRPSGCSTPRAGTSSRPPTRNCSPWTVTWSSAVAPTSRPTWLALGRSTTGS